MAPLLRAILLCVFVFTLALGCGDELPEGTNSTSSNSSTPDASVSCVEGSTQACVCVDGSSGAQVCGPSGTFGACSCAMTADAGTDANTNNGSRNLCGGFGTLSAAPGTACGPCLDGINICDGIDAVRCLGESELNACGGCDLLRGEPTTSCGDCDDGLWMCDGLERVVCDGATSVNVCGGCANLTGQVDESCDGGGGYLSCTAEDQLTCIGFGENLCGGAAPLAGQPATACGACLEGIYACDPADPDTIVCDESTTTTNACGGCTELPASPGEPCGECGGSWVCSGAEDVRCDAVLNPCLGCGPLNQIPGDPCPGGIWACDSNGSLACSATALNACGGVTPLFMQPGEACGPCDRGRVLCASAESTFCSGAISRNECGGCEKLARTPGESCGPSGAEIICDGMNAVLCDDPADRNPCGGTGVLPGTPGDPCTGCGTWACTGRDSVVCADQDTDPNDRLNCGSCGNDCTVSQACINATCQTSVVPWVDIELGRAHGCAIDQGGDVFCWGDNSRSQLGVTGVTSARVPVQVAGLSNVLDLAAAEDYSCAVEPGAVVKCWGTAPKTPPVGPKPNADVPEIFGSTTTTVVATPTVVPGTLAGTIEVDAFAANVCVRTTLQQMQCWGDNTWQQLATGSQSAPMVPGPAIPLGAVGDIGIGSRHICAISNDEVYCWGHNQYGQTGNALIGSIVGAPTAVDLDFDPYLDVSAGHSHTCATTSTAVYCWGDGSYQQIGRNTSSFPVIVNNLPTASFVEMGHYSSYAATATGLYSWGWREEGRLGDDTATGARFVGSNTPPITTTTPIDIAASDTWACALESGGVVKCWGTPPAGAPVLLDGQIEPSAARYVPRTSTLIANPGIELCINGADDDGDGLNDCDDPDCFEDDLTGTGAVLTTTPPFDSQDGNYLAISAQCSLGSGIEKRFRWTAPAAGNYLLSGDTHSGTRFAYYVIDACGPSKTELACFTEETRTQVPSPGLDRFSATAGQQFVIVVEWTSIDAYTPAGSGLASYSFSIDVAP